MTPRVRYRVWVACVAALLVGVPITFVAVAIRPSLPLRVFCTALHTLSFIALIVLLLTTPTDAIKLPPGRSIMMVTLGTSWLTAVTWLCFDRRPISFVGIIVMSGLALSLSTLLAKRKHSPWWAAGVLWHHGIISPSAWSEASVVFSVMGIIGVAVMSLPHEKALTP